MHQTRRGRPRGRVPGGLVVGAVVLAAATAGYVLASFVAGFDVPDPALVTALVASWLCILALALLPRAVALSRTALEDSGRDVDLVSGLLRYDPEHDDEHVNRACGQPWAVLVVEVDAHVAASAFDAAAADAVLADAAERIGAVASSYGGIARRLNGPQFVVLVAGLEESALTALAGTLHDGVSRADTTRARAGSDNAPPYGRLVVGVAVAAHAWDDVQGLIRSATAAITQGKRLASGTPVFFHPRLAEEARERLAVGRALRTALDERHIDLVYQPQIDLVDGTLHGVEVLARLHDSVLGTIATDRFVHVAGELGLSRQLDRLVCELAFAQLHEWEVAGVPVPRICVNVTPHTIAEGRGIGLAELLTAYGIRPGRVTVEIMESRILEGATGARAVQRLRDLGLLVALDDFGSGQSSFSQLVTLPVTGLKIDRSLLGDHDADAAVLGAIIQAGTALGLAVTAVGVETVEQRDLLRRLGCVIGQGHLFSRPLTAAEFVDWLRSPLLVG